MENFNKEFSTAGATQVQLQQCPLAACVSTALRACSVHYLAAPRHAIPDLAVWLRVGVAGCGQRQAGHQEDAQCGDPPHHWCQAHPGHGRLGGAHRSAWRVSPLVLLLMQQSSTIPVPDMLLHTWVAYPRATVQRSTAFRITLLSACCAARLLPGRPEQAPRVHLHVRQRADQLGQGGACCRSTQMPAHVDRCVCVQSYACCASRETLSAPLCRWPSATPLPSRVSTHR